MQTSAVFMLLLPAFCFGVEGWFLQSELRTNFSEASSFSIFTAYTYNSDGKRVEKRVFEGVDSISALMNKERFVYDLKSRCIQDLLLNAAGDTLSIVRNLYGNNTSLESASILNKDGSVRFKDSLLYINGNLAEQRRYNSSASISIIHRYKYSSGLCVVDSLFESNGVGGFIPTQARLISYNVDSTVSKEIIWRESGDQWYCISTSIMVYDQKHLSSVTTYETDALSKKMMDSVSFVFNDSGNLIKQTAFNNSRIKIYEIFNTWITTVSDICITSKSNRNFSTVFSDKVTVYNVLGKKIIACRIKNEGGTAMKQSPASGRYIISTNKKLTSVFR
jgi:hypothetical protein